jgi:glycine/D-amino acid oxidase-like deaminating enzyme
LLFGRRENFKRTLDNLYGSDQRQLYRETEKAAVDLVDQFITNHDLDVDRHSNGETLLAHKPKHARDFPALQVEIKRDYGVTAEILGKQELRQNGLGGAFHGAITTPIGFGLNPQKYASGLLRTAISKGAQIYAKTPAQRIIPTPSGYDITTPNGTVSCKKFIIATNGYSSEDMFPWMRARFLPVQSSVIVTRPITDQEKRHRVGPVHKWPMIAGSYCTISA